MVSEKNKIIRRIYRYAKKSNSVKSYLKISLCLSLLFYHEQLFYKNVFLYQKLYS